MRHLVYLRRMILSRDNTCIDFSSHDKSQHKIYCSKSGFIGQQIQITKSLQKLIEAQDCQAFKIPQEKPFEGLPSVPVTPTLALALREIEINKLLQQRVIRFSDRLPDVTIRLISLHRTAFAELTKEYLNMHTQSLRTGHINLAKWLKESQNDTIQQQRIKLFIIVFCLGIVAPMAKKRPEENVQNTTKASVLERIINRVRAIR